MKGIEKTSRSAIKEDFAFERTCKKALDDSTIDALFKEIVLSKKEIALARTRQKRVSWIGISGLVLIAGYYFHTFSLVKMALMGLFIYVIYKRCAITCRVIGENKEEKSVEQKGRIGEGLESPLASPFDQNQIMLIKQETYRMCTYLEETVVKIALTILLLSVCDTLNRLSVSSIKGALEVGTHVGIAYILFCEQGVLLSKILENSCQLPPPLLPGFTIEAPQQKPPTSPYPGPLDRVHKWNIVQSPDHFDLETDPMWFVEEEKEPYPDRLDMTSGEVNHCLSDRMKTEELVIPFASSRSPLSASKIGSSRNPLNPPVLDRHRAVCPSSDSEFEWINEEGNCKCKGL